MTRARRRGSYSSLGSIPSKILLPRPSSSSSSTTSGSRRRAPPTVLAFALVTLALASSIVLSRQKHVAAHFLRYADTNSDGTRGDSAGQKVTSRVAAGYGYINDGKDPLARYYNPTNPTAIRKWGCNLPTTPLIFVHIGKAGGGSVRARFAASALNYTRGERKKDWVKVSDGSYYDVGERLGRVVVRGGGVRDMNNSSGVNGAAGEDIVNIHQEDEDEDEDRINNIDGNSHSKGRAYFCNSGHSNRRPNLDTKTFEGQLPCKATTPIGRAVACPEPIQGSTKRCKVPGCEITSEYCHQVYVGHNAIGTEFHWLPPKFLHRFWDSISMPEDSVLTRKHPDDVAYIDRAMRTLDPTSKEIWCRSSHRGPAAWRPHTADEYRSLYYQCSKPLANSVDLKATEVMDRRLPRYSPKAESASWAPVYASLPVLRATVVREPFSWFVSKYFWHYNKLFKGTKCDDPNTDWMGKFAVEYIMKLCGEDCYFRLELNEESLESLAFQAENNLRQSFAVVGLVNETDIFYDMVTARTSYVNMSRNVHITGQMHSSSKKADYDACQQLFAQKDFQRRVMSKHNAVALLKRLFGVAEEVNRFQMQELRECSGGIL